MSTMIDKELLELAAKAAGYQVDSTDPFEICIPHKGGDNYYEWNPLTDDGDALRLERRLKIVTEFLHDAVRCKAPGMEWVGETCLPCDTEHLGRAHRRAIVRAAAEIGKAMP